MKTRFFKHITAAVMLAGAGVAFTSCEDFLDTTPESSFTTDEIFGDETETKAMMGSIYSKLTNRNLYGLALPYTFNTNTDVEMKSNGNQTSTSGNGDEAHCFDVRSLWGSLRNTWNSAYEAINYCNDFLQNMEAAAGFSTEIGENGPTEMQQMYGEVKCIRAMLYLDLIRTWGDVVFRTEPTEASETLYNEGTTNRDEIYAKLIDDLREVEPMMKYASQMEDGVERASREYCQALIGQLALYRGGYSLRPGGATGIMERPADYTDYYQIARTYLGKVISEGRHSLALESFEDLWRGECNWTVLDNGDVIFEVPMLKEYSGSLGYNIGMVIGYDEDHPSHNYGQGRNNCSFSGLYPFTFDQRDLRLDMTCVPYSYDEDLNQTVALGKSCVSGWNVGKWSKMYMGNMMTGHGDNTGINSIRMRYADVLLMYAEVVNELSGPTSEAKEALKTVRRRAFAPEHQAECVEAYVDALNSPEAFFQAIVDERAWEFGGEGVRKYDLARWNLYGQTLIDLYNTFTDWGKRAQGQGVLGEVRDQVYWRELPNPQDPSRTIIEFKGLKEYGDAIGEHPASEGWKNIQKYANQWWDRNKETDEWEVHNDVKWSFRGYVNYNNASTVSPTDPVRYLMPYPVEVITAHRGSIQQQYGYQ